MSTSVPCQNGGRANNSQRGQRSSESQWTGADHSVLAMEAARSMRRVKHKAKHGRVICHHLRAMLTEERPLQLQRVGDLSKINLSKINLSKIHLSKVDLREVGEPEGMSVRQISLGF